MGLFNELAWTKHDVKQKLVETSEMLSVFTKQKFARISAAERRQWSLLVETDLPRNHIALKDASGRVLFDSCLARARVDQLALPGDFSVPGTPKRLALYDAFIQAADAMIPQVEGQSRTALRKYIQCYTHQSGFPMLGETMLKEACSLEGVTLQVIPSSKLTTIQFVDGVVKIKETFDIDKVSTFSETGDIQEFNAPPRSKVAHVTVESVVQPEKTFFFKKHKIDEYGQQFFEHKITKFTFTSDDHQVASRIIIKAIDDHYDKYRASLKTVVPR